MVSILSFVFFLCLLDCDCLLWLLDNMQISVFEIMLGVEVAAVVLVLCMGGCLVIVLSIHYL